MKPPSALGKMNASGDDLRDFAFKARDRQTASLENVRRPNSFLFSPRPNLALYTISINRIADSARLKHFHLIANSSPAVFLFLKEINQEARTKSVTAACLSLNTLIANEGSAKC
jgi:hypothetical protein